MDVVVSKEVHHLKLGRLVKGRRLDFPDTDPWLNEWLRAGVLERVETKVLRENPYMAAGTPIPLSVSPAAPASVQTTSQLSKLGEKKRGRARKA